MVTAWHVQIQKNMNPESIRKPTGTRALPAMERHMHFSLRTSVWLRGVRERLAGVRMSFRQIQWTE